MAEARLGSIPLSRWRGLRDDLENRIAGPQGEKWMYELGMFLRRDPDLDKVRRDFGEGVWDLGHVRVHEDTTRGRWVNGVYRDSWMILFTNQRFIHTRTHIYDAKTFELFEWHQSDWPVWDLETIRGFCTAVGSDEFRDEILQNHWRGVTYYSLAGKPAQPSEGRFKFSCFGAAEISFALPEVKNGCISPIQLYRAVHEQLRSADGRERLSRVVD